MEIALIYLTNISKGGLALSETEMTFWIAVAALILLLDLRAIVSVFRTRRTVAEKAAWAVGLFFFPAFGVVVWGIAGAERSRRDTHFPRVQ
jgi:hypothetical protein